MNFLVYLVMC